jgi:hypothetical protein
MLHRPVQSQIWIAYPRTVSEICATVGNANMVTCSQRKDNLTKHSQNPRPRTLGAPDVSLETSRHSQRQHILLYSLIFIVSLGDNHIIHKTTPTYRPYSSLTETNVKP